MTTLPPGFGVQTLSGFDSTIFTWITTTRQDSSSTVLPVVGGLALWNVPPILNVRFRLQLPGIRIPEFSFPCIRVLFITVGNCDNPPTSDEDPEPTQPQSSSPSPSPSPPQPPSPTPTTAPTTTQSSASCTETQRTSACQATCALSRGTDGDTTTDCYTTICSITYAPCSVTATTSTTFLSTTSQLQCPLLDSSHEDSCPPDDPGCARGALQQAPQTEVKELGSGTDTCVLRTNPGLTTVTWPWTPSGPSILTEDLVLAGVSPGPLTSPILQGSRTDLLRWLSTTTDPANCAPSIVSIAAPAFENARNQGIASGRKPGGLAPSVDHVFEKHWLSDFFASIIDPNAPPLSTIGKYYRVRKINCDDLHNYGFGHQRTRNDMGAVFNATPGGDINFLGLAGMAQCINGHAKVMCPNWPIPERNVAHHMTCQAKVANLDTLTRTFTNKLLPGKRVRPGDTFNRGYDKVTEALGFLQDVYIGFEALNKREMNDILTETLWKVSDRL